jgi:hypothetical protein
MFSTVGARFADSEPVTNRIKTVVHVPDVKYSSRARSSSGLAILTQWCGDGRGWLLAKNGGWN